MLYGMKGVTVYGQIWICPVEFNNSSRLCRYNYPRLNHNKAVYDINGDKYVNSADLTLIAQKNPDYCK